MTEGITVAGLDRGPAGEAGCRHGWTRVDLLVTVLMLLGGVGLLAPAVARTRARSARERSRGNLRQIGEGMQKYHAAFGFFPSNGGPPPETVTSPNVSTRYPTGEVFRWGFGDPKRAGRLQTGSYAYAILPFVGEEQAFRKQAHDRAVPIYYHPSRRPAEPRRVPTRDPLHPGRYLINPAGLNPWGRTDYAANDQVVRPGMAQVMRTQEITDGLAETALVAEKAMDLRDIRAGSEFWDQGILLGGAGATGRKGERLYRDSATRGEECADNWGSPDPAGVHFLFADGHVGLLDYRTPPKLVWALMTPDAGEDGDCEKFLVP
jgi:prepilin-type processing-associated H-X9-DG protein